VIGAIQNRIGEQVQWPSPLPSDWDDLSDILLNTAREAFEKKREDSMLRSRMILTLCCSANHATDDTGKLRLLLTLSQGTRTAFDQKTHKQVKQAFNRFTYIFHAAQLLENSDAETVVENVMSHLDAAELALREVWGETEFTHQPECRQTGGFWSGGANRFRGGSAERSSISSP
jgi:hypothetical protein